HAQLYTHIHKLQTGIHGLRMQAPTKTHRRMIEVRNLQHKSARNPWRNDFGAASGTVKKNKSLSIPQLHPEFPRLTALLAAIYRKECKGWLSHSLEVHNREGKSENHTRCTRGLDRRRRRDRRNARQTAKDAAWIYHLGS